MGISDRFEPLRCESADPTELLAAMATDTSDPFVEFASGDASRARRVLLQIGARFTTLTPFIVDDGLTLLHIAARFDLREATATLLNWGVPVDALAWPYREVGPLWRRLEEGLPLSIGAHGLGVRGLGPLHLAVLADHEEMVRYLLARGANPLHDVGLDHGVEGIEPASTAFLASTVAANKNKPSDVATVLRKAESSSGTPVENQWLDTGIPGPIMAALRGLKSTRRT